MKRTLTARRAILMCALMFACAPTGTTPTDTTASPDTDAPTDTEAEETTEAPHTHDFGEWNTVKAESCSEE